MGFWCGRTYGRIKCISKRRFGVTCNCDGFIGFSFLFFTFLFLSRASWEPYHFLSTYNMDPGCPLWPTSLSYCLLTTFLTLTYHDGEVAWICVAPLITPG